MDDSDLARYVGKPGEQVPPVDPADLKAVWKAYEDTKERDPATRAGGLFVGSGILQRACSPQADTRAVIYRCWLLRMLEFFPGDFWQTKLNDGQFLEAAFKVGARMPLEWMAIGQPRKGLPFDLTAFIEEVRKESGGV
jgi:hypothetical protein